MVEISYNVQHIPMTIKVAEFVTPQNPSFIFEINPQSPRIHTRHDALSDITQKFGVCVLHL